MLARPQYERLSSVEHLKMAEFREIDSLSFTLRHLGETEAT